jgi:glutamyl-tRNA synthetase
VRADDLLDATPSQAHLLDLLGRPRPAGRTSRWCSGPTASASPSGTVPSPWPDLAAEGVSPHDVRSRLATSLGLAELGEPVTMADLVERFDPAALPRAPWTYE